jgi:TonB family protein
MFLGLFASAALSMPPTRQREVSLSAAAGDEVKQHTEAVELTPDSPIPFENPDGAPVIILEAFVKIVKCPPFSFVTLRWTDYAVQEMVSLVNNSDKAIDRVILQFTDIQNVDEFSLFAAVNLEPRQSFVFGEHRKGKPEIVSLRETPGELVVKVAEVRFESGIVWESDMPERTRVDSEPVLLTLAQARYTQEALLNRISGKVRMLLVVGADGSVSNVRITRGLPHRLNEEAVREASRLRFKPAIKDGQPVEQRLSFEIDFNLPK